MREDEVVNDHLPFHLAHPHRFAGLADELGLRDGKEFRQIGFVVAGKSKEERGEE